MSILIEIETILAHKENQKNVVFGIRIKAEPGSIEPLMVGSVNMMKMEIYRPIPLIMESRIILSIMPVGLFRGILFMYGKMWFHISTMVREMVLILMGLQILKLYHHFKGSLVVALAALASMLIARQELLPSSFEYARWLWLSISVFSGPLCALVMMIDEKMVIADVIFVLLVTILAVLPIWIALKKNNFLIYSIGVSIWICVGYLMTIAIYI